MEISTTTQLRNGCMFQWVSFRITKFVFESIIACLIIRYRKKFWLCITSPLVHSKLYSLQYTHVISCSLFKKTRIQMELPSVQRRSNDHTIFMSRLTQIMPAASQLHRNEKILPSKVPCEMISIQSGVTCYRALWTLQQLRKFQCFCL